jgi:branched-chain amino acid transport system permease protein
LFSVAGVNASLVDVLVIAVTLLLVLVLEWLVFRTSFGRAMRAVSFNTQVASLMGVPADRVISTTFVTGSMLAAAAGFLYSMKYPGLNQPAHSTWILLGLKAFAAAVVGGIGNVRGAMFGGMLIGWVEMFGAAYLSASLRDVFAVDFGVAGQTGRPVGQGHGGEGGTVSAGQTRPSVATPAQMGSKGADALKAGHVIA